MKTTVDGYDWFQREFKGIAAGDVFYVPIDDGFGFGRVLNTHGGASIAEFFKYWSRDTTFTPDIITSGRIMGPVGLCCTKSVVSGLRGGGIH